jgi:GNAT superfamily N-acetyltransferase
MTTRSCASGVQIRSLDADDRTEVAALFGRLSPESMFQRFHSGGVRFTDAMLDQVTDGRVLIAELDGCLVGLASSHALAEPDQAELAVVVDDNHQRRGIGTVLCAALYGDARRAGIRRLRAELLRTNYGMLRLLQSLNRPLRLTASPDALEVTLDL